MKYNKSDPPGKNIDGRRAAKRQGRDGCESPGEPVKTPPAHGRRTEHCPCGLVGTTRGWADIAARPEFGSG